MGTGAGGLSELVTCTSERSGFCPKRDRRFNQVMAGGSGCLALPPTPGLTHTTRASPFQNVPPDESKGDS